MKRIVCFGDSNVYGYDPRSWLGGRYPSDVRWTGLLEAAGWQVRNEGFNGQEIPTAQWEQDHWCDRLRLAGSPDRGETTCCVIRTLPPRMWQAAWRPCWAGF